MGAGESREEGGEEQWLSVVVVCKKRCVSYVIDDLHLSNVCTNASNVWAPPAKSMRVLQSFCAPISTLVIALND